MYIAPKLVMVDLSYGTALFQNSFSGVTNEGFVEDSNVIPLD